MDDTLIIDDAEGLHEASETVLRHSPEAVEPKSGLGTPKGRSESIAKEGLRQLAEDLSWQIDDIQAEETKENKPASDVEAAEQKVDNIDEDRNIEETENVNEQETKEVHIVASKLVEETAIPQAVSAENTGEIKPLPNDAEFHGVQSFLVLDSRNDQVPEMYSQTQLRMTPLEQPQDLNIKEIFLSSRRTFYGAPDSARESKYEEKQDVELQMKKEEMLMKLHKAMLKQDSLQWTSLGLQSKISDYYKKRNRDEKQDQEKPFIVNEEAYLKRLGELKNVREMVENSIDSHQEHANSEKLKCRQKKEEVAAERKKLLALMQKVVQGAVFSHTRKPIPSKDVEHYLTAIPKREYEISKIRLAIIKLKSNMDNKKLVLRSKEELADGLRIQDFEQLKIENQTYNEKIEEKNEDMLKLKRKICSTVQVLSHCKEKLQYVQRDNLQQVSRLKEVDISLANSRSILAKAKQARDVLKAEHAKLLQESGLLGNQSLLNDFEGHQDQKTNLTNKLQQVKFKHKRLSMRCTEVQSMIVAARKKTKKSELAS